MRKNYVTCEGDGALEHTAQKDYEVSFFRDIQNISGRDPAELAQVKLL